jgi:hypothetical protein
MKGSMINDDSGGSVAVSIVWVLVKNGEHKDFMQNEASERKKLGF